MLLKSSNPWLLKTIAAGVALTWLPAIAEEQEPIAKEREIETTTVVATKTTQNLRDIAGSVSIIDQKEIESKIMRDISDLVKYEPGVSVSGTGNRFGLSGFTIRGIGGNRVLTLVDGVRVADEFSFGPALDARRDFISVQSLERVEIAKGSGSSLYGSDALGGVVSLTTRRPDQYVDSENTGHASYLFGASSDDSSFTNTLTLAGHNSGTSALLEYTQTDSDENETAGSGGFSAGARQEADPLDQEESNLRVSVGRAFADMHRFTLSYEDYESEVDTKILSDYGSVISGRGPSTTLNSRDAFDTREKQKLAVSYQLEQPLFFIDNMSIVAYQQKSESQQSATENRTPISGPEIRSRFSSYGQDILGINGQASSIISIGNTAHLLTFGVDHYLTESTGFRAGSSVTASGTPVRERTFFPTRDFPITEVENTGLFIQDEISLLEDSLRVTPSLRYDRYEAMTQPDAIWVTAHVGDPLPSDYKDSDVTAGIGVLYKINETATMFASFSEGFRAPSAGNVNSGFTNAPGNYKVLGNPNLTSESSEGIEAGLRLAFEYASIELSIFHNEYEDFIEENVIAPQFLATRGVDPSDGYLTFTTINRGQVEIEGAELAIQFDFAALGDGWIEDISLEFAVAYADGTDEVANEPLDSIEPLNGAIGISYDAASGIWGGELSLVFAEGKSPGDIASTTRYEAAGYGQLDLLGYYNFGERVDLSLGLFNLTDKAYVRWSDGIAIGSSDAPLRFSQPGFHAGLNLRITL